MTDITPIIERIYRGHCWIKTDDGPRRIAERFTDDKLASHIAGKQAYGACPITPGTSTTRLALFDLDNHRKESTWEEMLSTSMLLQTKLLTRGIYGWLWRSSGGNGIHIFILWEQPQDAYSVRQALLSVLADCVLVSGTGGVAKGEVEIFPKQDSVPLDGSGSMFILPLAGKSETLGEDEPSMSTPVPILTAPVREATTIDTPELKEIKSALDAIPNSGDSELDYDQWRNIVFAVHSGTDGSDEGLALVHEFSGRSAKHDATFLDERVWPYARSDRDSGITVKSLYHAARLHGWQEGIAGDFSVVTAAGGASESTTQGSVAGNQQQRFRVIPADVFAVRKHASWIIKNVLPRAELGVVFGESGSGKSFFTLDLVAAIARGEVWRGYTTTQGSVIYIAAEGANGFRNRLTAYQEHTGVQLDTLPLGVIADAPNLMVLEDARDLNNSIVAHGPVSVIVIDTFSQVMPGANENAGEDVGRALAHCKLISQKTKAMVLLIHHSGKDSTKGARGWSGLRAAADVEIEITRSEHDRVATITKLKDGEDGAEFGFKLVQVPVGLDEEGDVITSCVVEHGAAVMKDKRKREPKGSVERLVLRTVLDCLGDGGVADMGNIVGESVNQLPHDTNSTKKDRRREVVLRAIDSLRDSGRITIDGMAVGIAE